MRGTIEKRGRGYRVSIYLGYDNQGRMKRHRKTLSTRKAAEKYLRMKLEELETEGTLSARSSETFLEYLERWLDTTARHQVRPRTLEDYQDSVRRYLGKHSLGRQPLVAVTPGGIQSLYGQLLERIGPATIRKLHAVIRRGLDQAVKWRDLGQNPALYVDLPKQNGPRERPILNQEDFPRFINAALAEPRLGEMWVFALASAMRPEEYYALRWSDFDAALTRVTVHRALVRPRRKKEGEPAFRFEDPKTRRSRRTIVLEASVGALLADHRQRQNRERAAAGEAYRDHGLTFCTVVGTPLDHHNMAKRDFKRILRRAGLPEELSPYSLRHSAATALVKQRESLRIIQELLGHASIRLTADTYSHVTDDMLEEAASKLGAAMFRPTRDET